MIAFSGKLKLLRDLIKKISPIERIIKLVMLIEVNGSKGNKEAKKGTNGRYENEASSISLEVI
jgi:hypothetical protein